MYFFKQHLFRYQGSNYTIKEYWTMWLHIKGTFIHLYYREQNGKSSILCTCSCVILIICTAVNTFSSCWYGVSDRADIALWSRYIFKFKKANSRTFMNTTWIKLTFNTKMYFFKQHLFLYQDLSISLNQLCYSN
jgi:hypothetical protein